MTEKYFLALLKEKRRDYIEAIELFREAYELDKNNAEPLFKLAELFLLLKDKDKALYFAEECSRLK